MADRDDDEDNPFAAPQSDLVFHDDDDGVGERGHQVIDAGDVLSTSWEIFKADMGITIGGVILSTILIQCCAQSANALQIVAEMLKDQGDPTTSGILLIVAIGLIPLSVGGQFFLQLGQARLLLNIARGDHAQISDLFSGGRYFWRMVGASLLFGIMVGIGMVACLIPGIILGLMFFTYTYALIDEDPRGMECLTRARDASKGNLLTLFVLCVASVGINLLGVLMLCVGLLATFPLTGLMFAVAYCKMTGQRTVKSN
jgi:hypothetical protein